MRTPITRHAGDRYDNPDLPGAPIMLAIVIPLALMAWAVVYTVVRCIGWTVAKLLGVV